MSRPALWTREEIGRLKRLYPSERSFEEIVKAFPHRTSNAVRLKASRLGLRRPTITVSACPSQTILICSEGGEHNGYLFRCSNCGSWIQVDNRILDGGAITCRMCGSPCLLVT